tara:strand:+ start:1477 stop:1947 length:471 start_codon:yes stop_codon:yes gene_type:complete
MGFDLSGLSPDNPQDVQKPVIDWDSEPTSQEQEEYFRNLEAYEKAVPGHYFRNNVWWWRPLWQCIGSSCDDILSEDDITGGYYNDGYKISKEQAVGIAERMKSLIDNDTIKDYKLEYDKSINELPEDDFMRSYGFTVENLQKFIRFCESSGGFEIW